MQSPSPSDSSETSVFSIELTDLLEGDFALSGLRWEHNQALDSRTETGALSEKQSRSDSSRFSEIVCRLGRVVHQKNQRISNLKVEHRSMIAEVRLKFETDLAELRLMHETEIRAERCAAKDAHERLLDELKCRSLEIESSRMIIQRIASELDKAREQVLVLKREAESRNEYIDSLQARMREFRVPISAEIAQSQSPSYALLSSFWNKR